MCNFPARQLLEYAYQVVGEADPEDGVKSVYVCGVVKAMDDLRFWHEQLTGCQCWDEEVNHVQASW